MAAMRARRVSENKTGGIEQQAIKTSRHCQKKTVPPKRNGSIWCHSETTCCRASKRKNSLQGTFQVQREKQNDNDLLKVLSKI
jgi:hypothetical protein